MGKKSSTFWKRLFLFLFLEANFVFCTLYFWGFYGQVHETRLKYMVDFLSEKQKVQLSEALNFYYNRGIAKYSSGILLRCSPETESIINQFLWFNRSTFTYYASGNPSYHEAVVEALDYFDLVDDEEKELGTYYLERKLIRWHDGQIERSLTDKDKNSFLWTLIDAGTSLIAGSSTPVGISVTALSLLQKAGSDPAKAIPGIVVFKRQREINTFWTIGILTAVNLFISFLFIRAKK